MKIKWNNWLIYTLIPLLFTVGCTQVKKIVNRSSPREEFTEALKNSPIHEKSFVKHWQNAWKKAIAQPVDIALPYREKGVFFPSEPNAAAFHFVAQRGENVNIRIASAVNLFAEVYQINDLEEPLSYFKADQNQLQFEVESTGSYVLVIQPELLATGHYTLTVTSDASVAFPVSGRNSLNIQSFWGAMRDGGKRQHEGVDIFAPKGTPVLAVAAGMARASHNRLGGKVVWHRTDKGQNFYYAHLDSQVVRRQRVETGDTLGFVGNSGNAKYTPPHLHFGVYLRGRGAVDPFPYIDNVRPEIPKIKADTAWKYSLARISGKAANFRASPSLKSDPDTVLYRNTIISLRSATSEWYRVALPDGKSGYVHESLVDSLQALPDVLPSSTYTAYINPWSGSLATDSLHLRTPSEVYGVHDGHYLVRHTSGKFLWLKNMAESL